jgi:hypothetical protein
MTAYPRGLCDCCCNDANRWSQRILEDRPDLYLWIDLPCAGIDRVTFPVTFVEIPFGLGVAYEYQANLGTGYPLSCGTVVSLVIDVPELLNRRTVNPIPGVSSRQSSNIRINPTAGFQLARFLRLPATQVYNCGPVDATGPIVALAGGNDLVGCCGLPGPRPANINQGLWALTE